MTSERKKPGIRIDVSETRLSRVDLKSQAARKAAARRAASQPKDVVAPVDAAIARMERRDEAARASGAVQTRRAKGEEAVGKQIDLSGRQQRDGWRGMFGKEVSEDTAPVERLLKADDMSLVKGGKAVRISGSPLEVMISRKVLARRQSEAAQRFLDDWYNAGLSPVASIDHSRSGGGGSGYSPGSMPASEFQAAARHRWRKAVVHLGHRFAPYVVAVIIEGEMTGDKLDDIAVRLVTRKDAKQRSAVLIDVLKIALDHLADHYRIPNPRGERASVVRGWRDETDPASVRKDLWESVDSALAEV